jgi:hypothetical protein
LLALAIVAGAIAVTPFAALAHADQVASAASLVVDSGSVGGRCDDSRVVSAVGVATPWCSLTRAVAAAPAGSTVLVRGGVYPAVVLAGYAPASTVTFAAYPGEQPVLAALRIGSGSGSVTANVVFSGFKILGGVTLTNTSGVAVQNSEIAITPVAPTDCSSATASCSVKTGNGITLTPPAANLRFTGNYIHDGDLGVLFRLGQAPSSSGVPGPLTYQNIVIAGNTFSRMGGVVISAQNFAGVTIAGNVFSNDLNRPDVDPYCHCDSIHAIGGGDRLTIDGNLVYGGRGFLLQPGDPGGNCGPSGCQTMTNAVIENNVLVGRDFALRVISSPGIKILNNTIWQSEADTSLGLSIYGDPPQTTGAVVANNLIRDFQVYNGAQFAYEGNNDISQRSTDPGTMLVSGPGDISATPTFVAPGAPSWNYTLTPQSPGVGTASAAYAPAVDEPGAQPRSSPSMGAFGYETLSPATPTTVEVTPPASAARVSGAAASRSGRVRWHRHGATIVIDSGIRVSCSDGTGRCPVQVTASERVLGRTRPAGRHGTAQRTLAAKRIWLTAGSVVVLELRYSALPLRPLLRAQRRVMLTMHVSFTDSGHRRKSLTRAIVLA